MKSTKKYFLLLIALSTVITFQAAILEAITVVDNFQKKGIWSWWGSDAITIHQDLPNQALKVTVKNAGDKSIDNGHSTFGRDIYKATLDLSKMSVVKLRAKTSKDVTIRMNVKDVNGNVNNQTHIILSLQGDNQYHDLYFDFSGKWTQNSPKTARLDAEEIKEFIIFVNPGGATPWSGDILIDELSFMDTKPGDR